MKKLKNSKHYLVTKLNNKDKNIKNNIVSLKTNQNEEQTRSQLLHSFIKNNIKTLDVKKSST